MQNEKGWISHTAGPSFFSKDFHDNPIKERHMVND
jgi:hypothetical protein